MKLFKEDVLVDIVKFTQGIFDIYCSSEDMGDFLNLQGKLESTTLSVIA